MKRLRETPNVQAPLDLAYLKQDRAWQIYALLRKIDRPALPVELIWSITLLARQATVAHFEHETRSETYVDDEDSRSRHTAHRRVVVLYQEWDERVRLLALTHNEMNGSYSSNFCLSCQIKSAYFAQTAALVRIRRPPGVKLNLTSVRAFYALYLRPEPARMQLFCRMMSGLTVSVQSSVEDTVCELKRLVRDQRGVPVFQQGPIFNGRRLNCDPETPRCFYNIGPGSTIHIALRLSGD